jgi:hypothetical protein
MKSKLDAILEKEAVLEQGASNNRPRNITSQATSLQTLPAGFLTS